MTEEIKVKVTAETGQLERGLGRAGGLLGSFAARATLAAGAAAAGMVALTKASLANIDAQTKLARSLGLTLDRFQAMSLVANEAGVSTDKLAQMMGLMQRAVDGGSEAFGRLGISLSEISALAPDQQFARLAEALDGVSDPAQKTAPAMQLFGRSGRDAINMLSDYGAKAREAAEFQQRFGIAVSAAAGEQVERANDAVGRLGMAMQGLGNTIAVAVAPALESMANTAIAAMTAIFNLRTEAERFRDGMEQAFSGAVLATNEVVFGLERMRDALIVAGNEVAGQGIRQIIEALQQAQRDFDSGAIKAEEFGQRVASVKKEADRLVSSLSSVEQAQFSGVIGRLGQLWGALNAAATEAQNLRAALPGGAEWEMAPSDGSSVTGFEADPNAPRTRPQRPGVDSVFFNGGRAFGGGGGGGGGARDVLMERLETLRESLRTEAEVVAEWYAEQDTTLRDALEARKVTEEEYRALRERLEAEHQDRMRGIIGAGNSTNLEMLSSYLDAAASLTKAGGEKMSGIHKAIAIAQAVLSGKQAAVDAWQKGMQAGGPKLAFAYAAASAAKTASMIAGMASSGGRGAAGGGGGAAGAAAAAELPVQRVDISYTGPDFMRPTVAAIIDTLGEAARRGYRIDPRLVAG